MKSNAKRLIGSVKQLSVIYKQGQNAIRERIVVINATPVRLFWSNRPLQIWNAS